MDGPTVHCGPQTPARRDELCFSNGFACQVESTKSVVSTVTGIHNGKKDHHVSIKVFENSISFLTHDKGQNMQGQATLLQASFSHFERYFATDIREGSETPLDEREPPEELQFKVNVANFIQCLSIFGTGNLKTTSVRMDYDDKRCAFRLVLQHGEGNVLTECSMQTIEDNDGELPNYFLAFSDTDIVGSVIVLSDSLRDAFSEIYSLPGATSVYLLLSPTAPFFQLAAIGSTGRCDIEFPHGSESFSSFECASPQQYRYQLSLLQHALRALSDSHQTFIRMNAEGMLCLQHKIDHGQNELSFVEFVILPEDDGDDEGAA
jgi:hypothetical protein